MFVLVVIFFAFAAAAYSQTDSSATAIRKVMDDRPPRGIVAI